jgi:hypothetical protein
MLFFIHAHILSTRGVFLVAKSQLIAGARSPPPQEITHSAHCSKIHPRAAGKLQNWLIVFFVCSRQNCDLHSISCLICVLEKHCKNERDAALYQARGPNTWSARAAGRRQLCNLFCACVQQGSLMLATVRIHILLICKIFCCVSDILYRTCGFLSQLRDIVVSSTYQKL